MRQEAATLQKFYASPLGRHVALILRQRISALWPDMARTAILGHGYATPLMDQLPPTNKARIASMPASQGATTWSSAQNGVSTALVEDTQWPFFSGMFDRVIILHGIEESLGADKLLSEAWRVLAPEGRIVVIASNRLGLWSGSDRTPFGHGRPWSRLQLSKSLNKANFQVTAWAHALYTPPFKAGWMMKFAETFEKVGSPFMASLSGLVMVEGVKRLYIEPKGLKSEGMIRVPIPAHSTPATAPKVRAAKTSDRSTPTSSLTNDRP